MLESVLRSHTEDNQLEFSIIDRQVVGHFQSTGATHRDSSFCTQHYSTMQNIK